MLRAVFIAAALLGPALVLMPTSSACCHILYLREDVGPCYVEWYGDGFRLETDEATVSCAGHGATVGPIDPLP